ncbi:MAG: DUF6067 family protein [Acidobacteriota bacterium]|nr:DUF6067 family protein [Acidobacteriota bacterium]
MKNGKRIVFFGAALLIAGITGRAGGNPAFPAAMKDGSLFVAPALRDKPIKWYDPLPQAGRANASRPAPFAMSARPEEFYVYQLGVWATGSDLQDVRVEYSDLRDGAGHEIPAGKMTCFNAGGIDIRGRAFSKTIDVPAGRAQGLWIGLDLQGAAKGVYTGSVSVRAGAEKSTVPLRLEIAGEPVVEGGIDEGWRLARLSWLNATVGSDEDVSRGYLPVGLEGRRISILGRALTIADDGLPASIVSFFDGSNQALLPAGAAVVEQPFRFIIEKEDGTIIRPVPGGLKIEKESASAAVWSVRSAFAEGELECRGRLEYDGFVDYQVRLRAKTPLRVKDIRLEVPVVHDKAEYMMGLGHEGGLRTSDWKWKWDTAKNQDMLWLGAVNGGLRIKWKAENYVRPLVNVYYHFGPLRLPPSWGNGGKGGVDVAEASGRVVVKAYSGSRVLEPGRTLAYDFELLLTPFRTIDRRVKFGDRYYHGGGGTAASKIAKAASAGANVVNIHHAEDIYPFINYPYLDQSVADLTRLADAAHESGRRLKLYYTTRELTKNLPEFWAFFSLNGEVIFPGPGNESRVEAINPNGPDAWLKENLREKYIPAWFNLVNEGRFKGQTDLAVITAPDGRLNNFYVAGLDWMVRKMGLDGVYIDDSALDRLTLRRARKIIDRARPEGRIDLHSWNHFCEWAGFANCLNLYMDLLPYVDLAWIGEGRDYNRRPDHWLIEVSGIPFGLTGQMLQGGGHAWRGMVYGITNRAGWTEPSPEHLWSFFDDYDLAGREMIGYWDPRCPVRTDNADLAATVYRGAKDVLIAVGNWSADARTARLRVDWRALNLDPEACTMTAPEIVGFQSAASLVPGEPLHVEGAKGLLLLIRNK